MSGVQTSPTPRPMLFSFKPLSRKLHVSINQLFSTWLGRGRHLETHWETRFLVVISGGESSAGTQQVETRDDTKQPTMPRTLPHNKELPSPVFKVPRLRNQRVNNIPQKVLQTYYYPHPVLFCFLKSMFRVNENSFKPEPDVFNTYMNAHF